MGPLLVISVALLGKLDFPFGAQDFLLRVLTRPSCVGAQGEVADSTSSFSSFLESPPAFSGDRASWSLLGGGDEDEVSESIDDTALSTVGFFDEAGPSDLKVGSGLDASCFVSLLAAEEPETV